MTLSRIDGREATRRVREYFTEVHGEFGVVGFFVEKVEYREANHRWYVKCRVAPFGSPHSYEVLLADTGEIEEVTEVIPPSTMPPPPRA